MFMPGLLARAALSLLGAAITLGVAVLASPALAGAFTPVVGNWDGELHGQPISWQLVRSGRGLLVSDFVNGAPTCTPARQSPQYGLNAFASFASVTHNVFGSPPLALLGIAHPASRYGYGGRFLSRTRAVFGDVGPARHLRGCFYPPPSETFSVRAIARRAVADGSWAGSFASVGSVSGGASLSLTTSLGGRLIDSYSASIPVTCGASSGSVSFSHGRVFVHPDGTFDDSFAVPSGRVKMSGRFEALRSARGTFSAPGPPGAGCATVSGSWTLQLG